MAEVNKELLSTLQIEPYILNISKYDICIYVAKIYVSKYCQSAIGSQQQTLTGHPSIKQKDIKHGQVKHKLFFQASCKKYYPSFLISFQGNDT